MQTGSSGEVGAAVGAADTRGKHRISAELKRLEQEIRFLEVCFHFDFDHFDFLFGTLLL